MTVSDLLTPWVMLIAVLAPLVYIETWIHSHLYGVGWLLTDDEKSATILYYILLFPGVLLHEVVQWLVAGAIGVRTKTIRVWPEPQKDGTLRLDFVQLEHPNKISAAIIGAAPLAAGLAIIWAISNYVLNLDRLLAALGTSDLPTIAAAIADLASTPDFYLWLYLLFAISNAMLPTSAEREGWLVILAIATVVIGFLILIGTGEQLLETYQETIIAGVERLTTAFGTVLVVELPAMITIGFGEEVLERITGRKFQYVAPEASKGREPGSSAPLPPGEPKPSVYLLDLPVPLPPDKPKRQRPTPEPAQVPPRASVPDRTQARALGPPAESRTDAPTLRPEQKERTRRDEGPQRAQPPAPAQSTETQRPAGPGDMPDRERRPGRPLPETPGRARSAGSRPADPTRSTGSERDRQVERRPSAPRRDAPEQMRQFRRPDVERAGTKQSRAATPDDETRHRDRAQSRSGESPERADHPRPRTPTIRPQFERTRPAPSAGSSRPTEKKRPASPPFVDEDSPAEDDDLEYIPFDDVELPPDDDF